MSTLAREANGHPVHALHPGCLHRHIIYHLTGSSQPSLNLFHRQETEARREVTCTRWQGCFGSDAAGNRGPWELAAECGLLSPPHTTKMGAPHSGWGSHARFSGRTLRMWAEHGEGQKKNTEKIIIWEVNNSWKMRRKLERKIPAQGVFLCINLHMLHQQHSTFRQHCKQPKPRQPKSHYIPSLFPPKQDYILKSLWPKCSQIESKVPKSICNLLHVLAA